MMNAKKAKALRAHLRVQGINPTECEYFKRNEHTVTAQDAFGKVTAAVPAYTGVLVSTCGRSIYKQMKKVA